jgi:hypothetical protein
MSMYLSVSPSLCACRAPVSCCVTRSGGLDGQLLQFQVVFLNDGPGKERGMGPLQPSLKCRALTFAAPCWPTKHP